MLEVVPPGSILAPADAVEPGSPALGPREALMIVHVDSEIPLDWIDLASGRVATSLPEGRHIWIVRAPAGRNAWVRLRPAARVGRVETIDLARYDARRRDDDWVRRAEFEFVLESGKINYPGELIVTSQAAVRSVARGYSIRNRNHSAMAIRALKQTHAGLLEAFPIRFAGPGEDGFLDHYTSERDRLRRESRE